MLFTLRTVITFILVVSFVTFIALFGQLPAFRSTPIGSLRRALCIHAPRRIQKVDNRLTGGRLVRSVSKTVDYLANEKHPLVMVFFLSLLGGSQYLFIPNAWTRLTVSHRILSLALCSVEYVLLYLSAYSDPGVIQESNHFQMMRLYAYDHSIFYPGAICRTCHFLKPARSKHCAICKRCIARHDHHCPWINNCVGYGNGHYFLLLLTSTALLVVYAVFLGYIFLAETIRAGHVTGQLPFRHTTPAHGEVPWSQGLTLKEYVQTWGWAIMQERSVGSVGLLCLLSAPLAWAFLGYHIYEIWAGMTTNESAKWSNLAEDMADGVVYRLESPRSPPQVNLQKEQVSPSRSQDVFIPSEVEPETKWPLKAKQFLAISEDGSEPLNTVANGGPGRETRSPATYVWRLEDIENIYDLGFMDNLLDTFRG